MEEKPYAVAQVDPETFFWTCSPFHGAFVFPTALHQWGRAGSYDKQTYLNVMEKQISVELRFQAWLNILIIASF